MTTREVDDAQLLALCDAWSQQRPLGRWILDTRDGARVKISRRGQRSYVRLVPWQTCLWLLLVELGAVDVAAALLVVRPGWRVRPSVSSVSHEHARMQVLALVEPRGVWSWTTEPAQLLMLESTPLGRAIHECGAFPVSRRFRGTLRWYEDDPAPQRRAELAARAREWSAHAVVHHDWLLEGSPGTCPVPAMIAEVPELGAWLEIVVERRELEPRWRDRIHARLDALLSPASAPASGF